MDAEAEEKAVQNGAWHSCRFNVEDGSVFDDFDSAQWKRPEGPRPFGHRRRTRTASFRGGAPAPSPKRTSLRPQVNLGGPGGKQRIQLNTLGR
jgi:hypothetical protein